MEIAVNVKFGRKWITPDPRSATHSFVYTHTYGEGITIKRVNSHYVCCGVDACFVCGKPMQ